MTEPLTARSNPVLRGTTARTAGVAAIKFAVANTSSASAPASSAALPPPPERLKHSRTDGVRECFKRAFA